MSWLSRSRQWWNDTVSELCNRSASFVSGGKGFVKLTISPVKPMNTTFSYDLVYPPCSSQGWFVFLPRLPHRCNCWQPQSADSIKMRWESFKSLYKRITIHTGRQKQLGCRWGMWLLSWVLISFTTLYAAKCLWYVIKPLCLNVEAIKTHSALGWCIKCYCCCLVYLCLQNTTNISDISIYQVTLQTAH